MILMVHSSKTSIFKPKYNFFLKSLRRHKQKTILHGGCYYVSNHNQGWGIV
jgi:hypothetical protein